MVETRISNATSAFQLVADWLNYAWDKESLAFDKTKLARITSEIRACEHACPDLQSFANVVKKRIFGKMPAQEIIDPNDGTPADDIFKKRKEAALYTAAERLLESVQNEVFMARAPARAGSIQRKIMGNITANIQAEKHGDAIFGEDAPLHALKAVKKEYYSGFALKKGRYVKSLSPDQIDNETEEPISFEYDYFSNAVVACHPAPPSPYDSTKQSPSRGMYKHSTRSFSVSKEDMVNLCNAEGMDIAEVTKGGKARGA